MDSLEKWVQAQLQEAGIRADQKVLLAVSGGRDSVVLGEILHRLQQPFAVAHLNYQLRADDSMADAELVKQCCKKWQAVMHLKTSCREELGANLQHGARELRYNWMRALCAENGYPVLLTAHHQSDQAETLLLATFKGRGSKAMAAMRVFDGWLLRPLLAIATESITNYAEVHQLSWREDASNSSLAYDRNFVRHAVLVPARERFPQLDALLAREASRLQQLEALAAEQVDLWRSKLVKQVDETYQSWTWKELPISYGDWVLGRLAAENGLEQSAIEAFLELRHKAAGKRLEAGGWTIVRTRAGVDWFKDLHHQPITVEIKAPGSFSIQGATLDVRLSDAYEPQAACCVPAEWMHNDLTLRTWQQGDRMLIGPNAHKKISDLLQSQQINYRDRLQTLVLASGQDVLWVIGLRKRTFDTSVAPVQGWLVFNWLP